MIMKNYSEAEINKRTSRILEAQRVRSEIAVKKDNLLYEILKEYPEGLTITQIEKMNVFPYSYLRNALRRLYKQGRTIRKEETVNQKIRYRWRVFNA